MWKKETKSSKWIGWHNCRQKRERSIHELLRRQKSIPAIIVGILHQRAETFVIQATENYGCKTASVQAGPSAQQYRGRCSAQSKPQHIKAQESLQTQTARFMNKVYEGLF